MRERKYKVWFPKVKRMIHFEGIRFCGEYDEMCFAIRENDCQKEYQRLAGKSYIPDEEGIPLDYTGLKDKNGKEIYEGDIFKITLEPEEINSVAFEGGSWMLSEHGLDLIDWYGSGEVIGNIYENPEVIEG